VWYFLETHGTRSLAQLAVLPNEDGEKLNAVAGRLLAGKSVEPPILIAEPDLRRLVILEGHNRMMGYARGMNAVEFPLRVLLGVSSRASEWSEW
jgi:hypothetical protein